MNKKSLVTIAIALYNNGKYVQRCINSVLNQTYQDLEVIVVNDGSTDDSIEKCKKFYFDKRLTIITQENSGLSVVRQRALDAAKGKYIMFIDADDYLDAECIEKLLSQIETTKSDICVCSTKFIDEDGVELSEYTKQFTYKKSQERIVKTENTLQTEYTNYIDQFIMSDSWNKIYRLSFIRREDLSFCLTKGRNGSDTAFNHKILIHSPIITGINYIGYYHVIYKKSAVHRKQKRLQEAFFEIEMQLIAEAKKCKVNNLMQQLSDVYIGMMLTAFQDVYDEEVTSSQNQKEEIEKLVSNHREFVKENKIKIHPFSYTHNTKKIFAFLLKYFPTMLLLFLKFRNNKSKRNNV